MRVLTTAAAVVCLALPATVPCHAVPAPARAWADAPRAPIVLAAVTQDTAQHAALFAVGRDGSVSPFAPQLAEPRRPAWSPDGRRLAVIDGGTLVVLDRSGTTVRTVGPASDVGWAPGGRRLVRIAPSGAGPRLLVGRVAGGPALDITPDALVDENTELSQLTWSPGGEWIGVFRAPFDAEGFPRPGDYRLIRPDGSHQRKLFRVDATFKDAPRAVVWAPDGRHLAVASGLFGATAIGDAIVSVPDGAVVRLGGEGVVSFAWSPDGMQLAGIDVLRAYPDATLVVWRADGSRQRELATGMQRDLAWPTSESLLAVGTPPGELWRYAWPDGGPPTVVARLPDAWAIETIAARPGAP